MLTWKTRLSDTGCKEVSDLIQIQRGVYQGDTMSPTLFCLMMTVLVEAKKSTSIRTITEEN